MPASPRPFDFPSHDITLNSSSPSASAALGGPTNSAQLLKMLEPGVRKGLSSSQKSVFDAAVENLLRLYKMVGPLSTQLCCQHLVESVTQGEKKLKLGHDEVTRRRETLSLVFTVVSDDKGKMAEILNERGWKKGFTN